MKFIKEKINRTIAFFHDIIMIPAAWFGAYWLQYNLGLLPHDVIVSAFTNLPFIVTIQTICFCAFGLYRGIWRFASLPDLSRIIKAALTGAIITALTLFVYAKLSTLPAHFYPPRSIFPLYILLLITFLGGSRFLFRSIKDSKRFFSHAKRVLIVGAGQAGDSLVRDLIRDKTKGYIPVAIVDDQTRKLGKEIQGIRVVGRIEDIPQLVNRYEIDLILIAIPTAKSASMRRIVNLCHDLHIPYRTLPSLNALAEGKVTINDLRKVSLDDLLGRDPVELDWQAIKHYITGKRIVVTGAGGSIGYELCAQILKLHPESLVALENDEYKLYQLNNHMLQRFPNEQYAGVLLDITDRLGVREVLEETKPQIVFHAAAYKHVPLLESRLRAAVHNNILGTRVIAEESAAQNVEIFTQISTDKTVNPTNIMGATKRVAEIICQSLNAHSATNFVTVRFGNVLGSAGSVVELFREQLAHGGPLTVTHPKITRFFMTIEEACQLILQTTAIGQGGELFVLDMGEPVAIHFLAEQIIRLSGKNVGEDIEIVYTGLRPGEKLYEELFHEGESLIGTSHEKILQAQARPIAWERYNEQITTMLHAYEENDKATMLATLTRFVPEYASADPAMNEPFETV